MNCALKIEYGKCSFNLVRFQLYLYETRHSQRVYSRTCLERSLGVDEVKVLMADGSLNEGRKCFRVLPSEHSAILLTSIKR